MASGRDRLCPAPVPSAFPQGSWPGLFGPLCTLLRTWRFVKIIAWWELDGRWPVLCGGGGSSPTGRPQGLWKWQRWELPVQGLPPNGTATSAAPHPPSPHDTETSRAGPSWWPCRTGPLQNSMALPMETLVCVTRGRRCDSQACQHLATWLGAVTVRPGDTRWPWALSWALP